MKTRKILISTALVALATTSFGQLGSMMEKLFPNKAEQVQYLTVNYVTESDLPERVIHLVNRIYHREADAYEAPVFDRTIYTSNAEVMYESEIGLESWMATPFENMVTEEEMFLESWMTAPFEAAGSEKELSIESWMTAPFNVESPVSDEELNMEAWMIAALWK
jgi:hypothetical protein